MANRVFTLCKPFCVATAIAAAAGAAAQDEVGARDETGSSEIVVTAPREIKREVVGRSSISGAEIEEISLTRRVSYADLDLTRYADVRQLEQRVEETAREACDQLRQMFPLATSSDQDCVENAIRDALMQVEQAALAAAR